VTVHRTVGTGRYRLEELVGEGGFGQVYRAWDHTLQRRVAVKVGHQSLTTEARHRFEREARIGVSLRHPHIITIYDANVFADRPYIVMEFVEASDLDKILARQSFTIGDGLAIIAQVASALAHLHEMGLLHRDVKPANVVMRTPTTALLMDFSLLLAESATALTDTGIIVGTPRYLAPELWLGASYSPATDVYALGVMSHHLLSGWFDEDHGTNVPVGTHVPLPPPSVHRASIPPSVDELVLGALAEDPELRCPSITDFLTRLGECGAAGRTAVQAVRPDLVRTPTRRARAQQASPTAATAAVEPLDDGRRRSLAPALVALLVCALALAFWRPTGGTDAAPPAELSLCPFPDGFLATLAGRFPAAPSWRLLQGTTVLAEGVCSAAGRVWVAEATGVTAQGPLRLELRRSDELVAERTLSLPSQVFTTPLSARVGERTIELTWDLHGPARAGVEVAFDGGTPQPMLAADDGTVRVVAPEATRALDYRLFVGVRRLAAARVRLGCVDRLDPDVFAGDRQWRLACPPLVVGDDVVLAGAGPAILHGAACRHTTAGPALVPRWHLSLGDHRVYSLHPGGSASVLAVLTGPDGPVVTAVDLGGPTTGSRVALTAGDEPVVAVTLGEAVIAVLARARIGACRVAVVDGTVGPPAALHGPSLPAADAFAAAPLDGRLLCLGARDGHVHGTLFAIDESARCLRLVAATELFTAAARGRLQPVPRDEVVTGSALGAYLGAAGTSTTTEPDDGPSSRVELVATAVGRDRVAVRCGATVGVVRIVGDVVGLDGEPHDLPAAMQDRISGPLGLADGRLVFVTVRSNDSLPPDTTTVVVTVTPGIAGEAGLRTTAVEHTIMLAGDEALCGTPGSWPGCWALPTLEMVHVFDTVDGRHRRAVPAGVHGTACFVLGSTLFVTNSDHEVRGLDLVDEIE